MFYLADAAENLDLIDSEKACSSDDLGLGVQSGDWLCGGLRFRNWS